MPRRSIVIALSALTVLAASACSQSEPPQQTSAPTESEAPPQGSTDPALQVEQPKNIKSITDACQLLTPDQLTKLGAGTTPEPDTTMYGESVCAWVNDDIAIDVALNTTTGTGPAKIYEDGKSSDNFAPTKVDGYPAARVDAQEILCRVEVGVTETESFAVNYTKYGGTAPEMQDPCGYAEKIASEVLKNIPNA